MPLPIHGHKTACQGIDAMEQAQPVMHQKQFRPIFSLLTRREREA